MLILGIDPGGIHRGPDAGTGLCVWDDETWKIEYYRIVVDGPRELSERVGKLWMFEEPDVIVCESFTPRWGQKFELDSVYLIGALQATYDMVMVAPATHKALVKDSVLNPIIKGQGFKIGPGHARDALRLCVYYSATVLRNRKTLDMLAGRTNNQEEK